jgi:DNA repair exonuclease SbcCD nuclease subunit
LNRFRLIHTADVHLDASYAAAGLPPGFGNRRRHALRSVFQSLLNRAQEWPADAVLIAGDLFDADRISRDTVAFLREQFERIRPIPVFIAPGNHDPYVATSPYASEAWPANVFIFKEPYWTAFALQHLPVTVHGFAFDGIDISSNPFGQLSLPEDGRLHLALGHGSERGSQPPEKAAYCPFDAAEAAVPGLAYLALGHYHRHTRIEGPFDTVMAYSGAPEGHDFSETGPRHYLEVEIACGPGAAPRVEVRPVVSSSLVYHVQTLDAGACPHAHALVEALCALPQPGQPPLAARIILEGAIAPELRAELDAVRDAAAGAFAYLEIVDATHAPEDVEALAEENTSLGIFMRRINQEIKDAPDEARRAMLLRAREVGLAAYRGREIPIRFLAEGAP